jgi:uncharacterized protein (UPF0333 family)
MMKGQLSQEFFLSLSAYLIVFVIAVSLAMAQLSNFAQTRDTLAAREVADTLGLAIDNVHLAGENASYNLTYAKGSANVTVSGRYLSVEAGSSVQDFALLTDRVNATQINSSEIIIRNTGGVILIEEH